MGYRAPIKDIRFALEQCAEVWATSENGPAGELDPELLTAILEGAGALASETLAPLNRVGDAAGVALQDAEVKTPPGFADAYRAFAEGGWQGLAADPAHGGQGLPRVLALAVMEMITSANMSFGLCPILTLGAIEALEAHGSDAQRALYLPKLVSGEWTGTMNLTEPQAGSDLAALTTRAEPSVDGTYRLTGQKIFITWGEHDAAANIVHLVLARLPDAPAGSAGISLFVAPKILPDGGRNALRCIGVEEKLGIHASPTCTMAFEGATAWLVGEPNRGLAHMFTMMNSARVNIGVQGAAIGEAAYQKALDYAKERRQGRAEGVSGSAPIILHPDIRRILVTMKAKTQAARVLCYAAAAAADRGDAARADLLTPIAKAWSTDWGVEAASLGLQVHGGMGFIEETGAAQFYRDARIAPIYEGTNGIQAIDLIGRKLSADGGAAMGALIAETRAIAAEAQATERTSLGRVAVRLATACEALSEATAHMLAAQKKDRKDALAGANAYLKLAGDVAAGMLLTKGVMGADEPEQEALLCFYAETVLAPAPGLVHEVRAGAGPLFDDALIDLAI
ncbi:MAG: acyl-CoA dehydrogenase [Hyphomonadaceae bacterium]|nr:acyl-CoA dehydrogenase [Hyphomonadaceae bacterium]